MTRPVLILAGALLLAACGRDRDREAATLDGIKGSFVVREAGLSAPRAVFHDPLLDIYFVANVTPARDGGTGFVSVLSAAGEVLSTRWIDGAVAGVTLRSPRGMVGAGDDLFVLDGAEIRRFERATGVVLDAYEVPGASLLFGIAASVDGALYFTDAGLRAGTDTLFPTGTDAVFRLTGGTMTAIARGPELGHPTVLALSGDTVWVGNRRGEVFRLEDGRKASVRRVARGPVTGLIAVNGDAIIATGDGGRLLRGPLGGPYAEIVRGVDAPAAIALDLWRMRVLVPMEKANAVGVVPLIDPDLLGFPR